MATNYFHFAEFGNWYEKLFATDSGYIPLFQRLIALLAWLLHIPYTTIPLFYNISGLIFQSLMLAIFSLPAFRPLIPSDGYRIIICIILCLVGDWETRNFINVSYFCLWAYSQNMKHSISKLLGINYKRPVSIYYFGFSYQGGQASVFNPVLHPPTKPL